METLGQKLRLTYYDGSDGPRIVIFGPNDADFQSLQELFVELSKTANLKVDLSAQPFVAAFGGANVFLSNSGPMFPHERATPQGLRRVGKSSEPIFEWTRTAEAWDYLAELIDPIVRESKPVHQYLTRYPGEDAIVVVSRAEYGDDILSK